MKSSCSANSLAAALLAATLGCTPPSPLPPTANASSVHDSTAPASSAAVPPPASPCDRSQLPGFSRELLAALEGDDPTKAETILLERLAQVPTDVAADLLLDLLRDVVEEEREATAKRVADAKTVPLVVNLAPSPHVATRSPDGPLVLGDARPQPPSSRLYRFGYAKIPPDEMRRHRALPSHLPPIAERSMRRSFAHSDHDVLAQPAGRSARLVVASRRGRPRVFSAPFADVASAQLAGDVLLVSLPAPPMRPKHRIPETGGSTSASPSPPAVSAPLGPDGLYAFDAASGALLWSAPGVVGAVVTGGLVVSAAETELVVREVDTGKITGSARLPEAPRALVAYAGELTVIGHKTEHVFVFAHAPPARPAELEELSVRPVVGAGELACHAVIAAAAYAARDLSSLDGALAALSTGGSSGPVLQRLGRAKERLAAWQSPGGPAADRIDLFAAAPLVVASPPWTRTPPGGPRSSPPGTVPRLDLRRTGAVAYRHWEHPEDDQGGPDQAVGVAPAERGKLPPGARADVPPYLGLSSLSLLVPLGADALLLYGERWLAVVRGQRAEKLFDLDAYRRPPIEKPKGAFDGPPTYVSAATMRGDVLYLCNGGGSYASMARGKTGFVTALDVRTGALLWQSDPVVCNSELLFWRGYLLTAYGFTSEPDFLYVLRAADGSRAARSGIENTPGLLRLAGDTLTVLTYEKRITFELGER